MNVISVVDAARGAIFVALEAGLSGTSATAHDHLTQDQALPFVALGDLDWKNEGGKRDPLLRITVDVETVYRGEDRAELLAIMAANETALVDVELTADGVTLHSVDLVAGAASGADASTGIYAGVQTFELYAEPA